jgi:hypothetical protein
VRSGDWKLVVSRGGNGHPELYDLAADPGEQTDLAAREPERVADLQRLYDAWNARQAEPIARDAAKPRAGGRRPGRRAEPAPADASTSRLGSQVERDLVAAGGDVGPKFRRDVVASRHPLGHGGLGPVAVGLLGRGDPDDITTDGGPALSGTDLEAIPTLGIGPGEEEPAIRVLGNEGHKRAGQRPAVERHDAPHLVERGLAAAARDREPARDEDHGRATHGGNLQGLTDSPTWAGCLLRVERADHPAVEDSKRTEIGKAG